MAMTNQGSTALRSAVDEFPLAGRVMAEAMTLVANTFNYDVLDDELNPIPNFLDAISAIALRVLGPDGEEGFMEFFFG